MTALHIRAAAGAAILAPLICLADTRFENVKQSYYAAMEKETARHETAVNEYRKQMTEAYQAAIERAMASRDTKGYDALKAELEAFTSGDTLPDSSEISARHITLSDIRPGRDVVRISPIMQPKKCVAEDQMLATLIATPLKAVNKNTASFRVVEGIGNSKFVSFEAATSRGQYLYHENFRIKCGPNAPPLQATFEIVKGLSDDKGVSFRSIDWPQYYITVTNNGELWIVINPNKEAATFLLIPTR